MHLYTKAETHIYCKILQKHFGTMSAQLINDRSPPPPLQRERKVLTTQNFTVLPYQLQHAQFQKTITNAPCGKSLLHLTVSN